MIAMSDKSIVVVGIGVVEVDTGGVVRVVVMVLVVGRIVGGAVVIVGVP